MTASTPPIAPAPTRNRLGITALVLVLLAIVVPIVAGIVGTIVAANQSVQTVDSGGWAVLGGFVFIAIGVCLLSPIAIAGVVLGIVSVFKHGQRKAQGIAAIVLGVGPSLAAFGMPAALDSLF